MNQNVWNQVKQCLNIVLGEEVENLSPELSFKTDLNMESLSLVLFQVELEEMFHFSFDPIEDDFEEIFASVGSLCHYLETKYDE